MDEVEEEGRLMLSNPSTPRSHHTDTHTSGSGGGGLFGEVVAVRRDEGWWADGGGGCGSGADTGSERRFFDLHLIIE